MTLEEAIARCEKIVKEAKKSYEVPVADGIMAEVGMELTKKGIEEYQQYTEWLKELAERRKQPVATDTNVGDTIYREDALMCLTGEYPADFKHDELIAKFIRRIRKLPSAQPEPKWIPCSKQLPKQGQEVICQCRANIIKVLKLDAYGDWYQDAEHCYMGGFVIAWMPLPEPYKEGGADG